jgi:hypothetical protein
MLAVLVLRDTELAALTRNEVLALEHLLHERMSEVARTRRSGDSSLLFAIKAAEYLAPLLDELGDDAAIDLLHAMAGSPLGRIAYDRLDVVATVTGNAA